MISSHRLRSWLFAGVIFTVWAGVIIAAIAGSSLIDLFNLPDPTLPMTGAFDSPSKDHPLGTDHLGRDVLARMLSGNSTLVIHPALAAIVASALGIILAVFSAVSRQAYEIIRFISDTILSLPAILLILATVTAIPKGAVAVAVAAVVLSVPMSTRYFYPTVISTLNSGYVAYARATGNNWIKISYQEILPSLRRPVIADLSIRFVAVVFLTATASFLTGSTGTEDSTWAATVGQELGGVGLNSWAIAAPTLAIITLTTCPALLLEMYVGRRR